MPRPHESAPYRWAMTDPLALAHRFDVPTSLPPYTAVTVAPGQAGFFLVDDQAHLCQEAGLYHLTGSLVHTLEEADAIMRAGGEAVLGCNAEIILFDMRQKLYPAETVGLTAANGENAVFSMSVSYRVESIDKLNRSGATYQPCEGGSEIRQEDGMIVSAFRTALADVADMLQKRAAGSPSAAEVEKLAADPRLAAENRARINAVLNPLGLRADNLRLSPARRSCPYCQKALSFLEIRRRFCSAVDEEGRPQEGCGRALHVCPHCETIVGPERSTCPTCANELLFCDTPGCGTYRKVERGRFCPVCKRACYPLPSREFLTLM